MKKRIWIFLLCAVLALLIVGAAAAETDPVKYTITWLNYDETVLAVTEVAEGEVPVYPGETPTREMDADYVYTFYGWNPEPVAATADTTYTAIYSAAIRPDKCGDNLYWSFDSNSYVLTITGNGDMEDYSPTTFPWYSIRKQIKEIVFPDDLTSIGNCAFWYCTDLQSVIIPNNVIRIGANAFNYCSALHDISISDGITSVEKDAFTNTGFWNGQENGPVYLDSVLLGYKEMCPQVFSIKEGTKIVADYAFSQCNILTKLVCSESLVRIGANSFSYCSNLSSVIMDNQLDYIGDYAFYECSNLKFISIPCSVSFSGKTPFLNCKAIDEVYITRGSGIMTSFVDGIYTVNSHSVTPWYVSRNNELSIVIEEGITTIGDYAFYFCTGLTKITIPDSVTTISEKAFYFCTGLTEITIGNRVTSIGDFAFWNCTGLTDVYYNGTRQMRDKFVFDFNNLSLSQATWHYLTPVSIEMKMHPGKLSYQEGESLDVTGGKITTYYEYDIVEEEALTAEMVSGFDNTKVGTQTLTVTFDGQITTFGVTVSHIPGKPVRENEVAATTAAEGHYDEVVYCTVCHAELSRERHSIPKVSAFDGTVTLNQGDVQFNGKTPYRVYNGKAQKPGVIVKDKNGRTLAASKYTVTYRNNTNPGTAYADIKMKDTGATASVWFKIYLPPTVSTSVQNVNNGIQVSWKKVDGAKGYVIYRRAWNLKDAGWTTFERWNNTTKTTWVDTKVYAGTRYQYGVKAYFADPMDNYNLGIVGPLKTTVRITTRTLNSVTPGSKKLTAKWSGSTVFTGYEVQVATDAKFTKDVKTVTINKAKTYQAALSGLKAKTLYYVRVRSYHIFDGMTYYGGWSNVLNAKTK